MIISLFPSASGLTTGTIFPRGCVSWATNFVALAGLFNVLGWSLFLVFLADVAGVDVGLVVFEAGAVLRAACVVERGAGVAFRDVLVVHRGGVESVVCVTFASLCVARGGEEQDDCSDCKD